MEQRVLCAKCHQEIHIDDFAGLYQENGYTRYLCNSIICLSELAKKDDKQ